MKKLILLTIVLTSVMYSAELETYAKKLKQNYPKGYETILSCAKEKWGLQYDMVVYELNQQAEGFYLVRKLLAENNNKVTKKLFLLSLIKWEGEEFGEPTIEDTSESTYFVRHKVDWTMVHYEFKNQLKSYKELLK